MEDFRYDFEKPLYKEEQKNLLKAFNNQLIDDFGLLDNKVYSDLSTYYSINCAPDYARLESLKIASLFLQIYFYFNDYKKSKKNYAKDIDELIKSISDNTPSKFKIFANFSKTLKAKAQNKENIKSFLTELNKLKVFYIKEKELSYNSLMPIKEFASIREITCTTYPYFELWKSLENFGSLDTLSLKKLEKLTVEIIYLSNDILSINQDKLKNKPNYVAIHVNSMNGDFENALNDIVFLHNDKIKEFKKAFENSIIQNNPNAYSHLNFLKNCVIGNHLTMRKVQSRYDFI